MFSTLRPLVLPLALTLAACGGDDAPAVADTTTVVTQAATPDADPPAADDPAPDPVSDLAAEIEAAEADLDADLAELDAEPEAEPAASPEPAATPDPEPSEDARYGSLGEALVGGWRLDGGPGETAFFETDGSFQLYIGDRLVEGGEWTAEEGILYFDGDNAYVIEDRRADGMTFDGPEGPLVLERID